MNFSPVKEKYVFPNHNVILCNNGDRVVTANDSSFHLAFRASDGYTQKWGRTFQEDPIMCPYGPEIADIEITTKCSGIRDIRGCRRQCIHCYRSRCSQGDNMSFDTFKNIFHKITENRTLTQIAFGTDASLTSNPDIWKIFDYCIENDVKPNVTVADIDSNTARSLVERCGAVSVSWYPLINKSRCYDSIAHLTRISKELNKNLQVNMHVLLADELVPYYDELINDIKTDERLQDLNAVVFLSLKQVGRGIHFNKISSVDYESLMDKCFSSNIKFGMDSCTCHKFMLYLRKINKIQEYMTYLESCERLLFSCYINVHGELFPCSFMEGSENWEHGISVLEAKNFERDVWYHPRVVADRKISEGYILSGGCNECHCFEI